METGSPSSSTLSTSSGCIRSICMLLPVSSTRKLMVFYLPGSYFLLLKRMVRSWWVTFHQERSGAILPRMVPSACKGFFCQKLCLCVHHHDSRTPVLHHFIVWYFRLKYNVVMAGCGSFIYINAIRKPVYIHRICSIIGGFFCTVLLPNCMVNAGTNAEPVTPVFHSCHAMCH